MCLPTTHSLKMATANNNNNNNVVDLTWEDDDLEVEEREEEEEIPDEDENGNLRRDYQFSCFVPGQPRPMERPRKFRNHWVSPSAARIKAFKDACLVARTIDYVPFPAGVPVTVEIWFRMKRPNSHFKSGNRWCSLLTNFARRLVHQPYGADIDNLAKLVLDAMNGVVYHDDRQVVRLVVEKRLDTINECHGSIHVTVTENQANRRML